MSSPDAAESSPLPRPSYAEPLIASALVTAAATAVSVIAPPSYVASGVAFVFLAATWWLVFRHDDAAVERAGLDFGGLVLPRALRWNVLARSVAVAAGWALGLSAAIFVPFYFGWRWYWHPSSEFSIDLTVPQVASDVFGQLMLIALPEEIFYRGYLQSKFDEIAPPKVRVAGALLGPGLLYTSAIFALGHLLTELNPARLAVFFPSLVFGFLRARSRGIGAGVVFHAMCNLFSAYLLHSYFG